MRRTKPRVLIVAARSAEAKVLAAAVRAAGATPRLATPDTVVGHRAQEQTPVLVLMQGDGANVVNSAVRLQAGLGVPVVLVTEPDALPRLQQGARIPVCVLAKPLPPAAIGPMVTLAASIGAEQARLRHLKASLAAMGEGVILTDARARVTFINPMAEQLTGWPASSAIGRPLRRVFHTVEEHEHPRADAVPSPVPAEEPTAAAEPGDTILVTRNRIQRHVASTITPINDAQGKLQGLVLVFRDMTNRRQAEVRRLNAERMEALARLSATIAHDLGNVLALISGHASAMREYLVPNSRAHRDTQQILEAAAHGNTILRRIRGIARAGGVAGEPVLRPVWLGELVDKALALFQETFHQQNIIVHRPRPELLPTVLADPDHLLDLLTDLLLNAAEAMPHGGTLTIEAHSQHILRPDKRLNPAAKPGRYAVLRIRDTGSGMDAETLRRIFEPFFTTKPTDRHLGLGLSVVQSAIQRYGGWIKAHSKPGVGTVFSVYLVQASEAARKAAEHMVRTRGATILVADDNEAMRNEIHQALHTAGYRVLLAASAAEALALFRKSAGKIDVAIIDMVMPDGDDDTVVRELLNADPPVSLVVTSGFSREYARDHLPQGNWRFLQKPFDAEQLLAAVRRALEQKPS